jgi:ABC-type bacteriocin/lantibiotic exporter with double-glycine peptidase domain
MSNHPMTQSSSEIPNQLAVQSGYGWLYGTGFGAEKVGRLEREERVRKLLPDDEDEMVGKSYDARLTGRLLRYLNPYRAQTIWAVVFMSISSLLHVAGPWLIGRAIDQAQIFVQARGADAALRSAALGQLRWWALLFIVVALAEWVTNLARIQLMAYAGTKVVADMRGELFRHLHKLSLNFHNNYLVDHGSGAVGLYPDRHYHRHVVAQLATGAGHLCPDSADALVD